MNKRKIIFYIGLFIIILPLLGFPNSWKDITLMICGVVIVFLSYKLKNSDLIDKENTTKTYIDNKQDSE